MRLLSTREVGEKLGLHPKTVERYFRLGWIKALKIGRSWRVPEQALETFVKARLETQLRSRGGTSEWQALARSKLAEVWNHPDEVDYEL